MAERTKNPGPSAEEDVAKLKDMITSGKLEALLAKPDPDDVAGSLRRRPPGVARLLVATLARPEHEKQIATLKPEQREPLQTLTATAKEHHG